MPTTCKGLCNFKVFLLNTSDITKNAYENTFIDNPKPCKLQHFDKYCVKLNLYENMNQ